MATPVSALLQGVAAVALQWGAWGGAGMAAADKALAARLARAGMGMLLPAAGLAALAWALCFSDGELFHGFQSCALGSSLKLSDTHRSRTKKFSEPAWARGLRLTSSQRCGGRMGMLPAG